MTRTTGLRARLRSAEGGFTLVELVVAMVITLMVMSALLGVFVSSISTVSRAKQRQTATALATQALERLRALPYDTVTAPDSSVSLPADPNVTGTPPRFRPAAIAGVDEPLVVNTVSPALRTETVDGVGYRVRTYVGRPPAGAAQQSYTVTVLVAWTSSASGGARTAAQRSTVYSPTGCLSTATRPFSGPCQAYFTAQAGQTPAGITVTNAGDSALDIPGFAGSKVELELPVVSTNLLLEQTTSATAGVATTLARSTSGTGVGTSGGESAASAVDSDPSSPAGQTAAATTLTQTSADRTLTGAAGSLLSRPSDADIGGTAGAVAAEPALCVDADASASQLTTGAQRRPCATASAQARGSAGTLTHDLSGVVGSALTMQLASVAAAPAPSRAVAAHLTAANPSACSTGGGPSGDGCVHAAARRTLGAVAVGGLPTGATAPAGFTTAWRVDGLTDTAVAERGSGSRAPAYARSGTLRYWNGTGYSSLDLATVTVPTATPAVTVVGTRTDSGRVTTVQIDSTVVVNPPEVVTEGPADCTDEPCTARATVVGGVRGQTTYTVNVDGVEVTRYVVVTDLGGLLAQGTYRAAPDA